MKKMSQRHLGLILIMAFFSLSAMFFPNKAKAANDGRNIYWIDATENSITVDWTEAADYEYKRKRAEYPSGYFDYFDVVIYDPDDGKSHALNGPGSGAVRVGGSTRQYTFTGLQSDKNYYVNVEYYFRYAPGSPSVSMCNITLGRVCTSTKPKELPVLGATGTTATVDYRGLIKELKNELQDKTRPTITYYLGYGDQANGKDNALKTAKAMIGKKTHRLNDSQGNYMLRGLSPNHTYTVVIGAKISYTDGKTGKIMLRYFQNDAVTTTGEDDSTKYQKAEYVPLDTSTYDSAGYNKYLISSSYSGATIWMNPTVTENSITVDWSSNSDESTVISPANGQSNIQLMCVECANYDPVADKRQYGYQSNYGPNFREAMKKIESSPIKVKNGDTSYTFSGLKNNTTYMIIMKCGFSNKSRKKDTVYAYTKNITTHSGEKYTSIGTQVKNSCNNAYMYDVTLSRNGKTAELDWTSALQQFLNQDVLKGYYPRSNSYNYNYQTLFSIGYAALPDTYSRDAVLQSYKAALNMAKDSRNYLALNVEDSYSNYKLYDLDPDKKYVFAISFNPVFYVCGESVYIYDQVFYADEKGINYYKAKKLGTPYDESEVKKPEPKPEPQPEPTPEPQPEPKPEPQPEPTPEPQPEPKPEPKPEVKSENPEEKPSDTKTENGSNESQENGQDKPAEVTPEKSESGNSEKASETASKESVTPVDTASNESVSGTDSIKKSAKKSTKAIITSDKTMLSARKLKKKAQTVTLSVDNSKGKITVKNLTKKKLADNAEIKIKGRKITIKFKKGAAKGTYKFKVTVGAKGKSKKTTSTVKVVVK
ncbi:fibronectin type III domain-containing protein [Butyrivibrio sp. WCE2006]|uniref:fibronectin type III domain-containing protein n=1 Tax=Butyrivibrio sp. WCE2006 TaxID=1410611 RepID=UPI000678723F|nr:fibronectin type III domain-containing protein [Butyrivibrio sp. WCE2006]